MSNYNFFSPRALRSLAQSGFSGTILTPLKACIYLEITSGVTSKAVYFSLETDKTRKTPE